MDERNILKLKGSMMLNHRDEYLKQFDKAGGLSITQSADAYSAAAFARCHGHPLAYICIFSSNYVAVVDLVQGRRLFDITVGLGPLDIDINRNSNRAYVTNFSENTVSVIDLIANAVADTVTVGSSPAGIQTSPDGRYLYVVHYGEPNVYVLDAYTLQKIVEIPLPAEGFQIAITNDGSFAYVTLRTAGQVAVIDLHVNLVVKVLSTGAGAEYVVFDHANRLAFVSNEDDNSVTPINVQLAQAAFPNIATSPGPVGMVLTQYGRTLYIANRLAQTVSVFDVFSRTELLSINVGNGPYGLAATTDERIIVVTNTFENTVSLINARENKVYATVIVGFAPAFLAIL